MTQKRISLVLAGALLASLALLTLPSCVKSRTDRAEAQPRSVTPRGALAADELAHVELFKRSSPSVVNVTSLSAQRDMFSMNLQQVPRGSGTGFVWDSTGHIVTNFHVIQGANGARVTLADQSSFDATLVGAFPDRDLAVLRIDAPKDKLPPLALGSSRNLLVGQRVYAIGNPFGLDQTLTTGIVSALNREIESFNGAGAAGAGDLGVDADQQSGGVRQRPPRIARIDRAAVLPAVLPAVNGVTAAIRTRPMKEGSKLDDHLLRSNHEPGLSRTPRCSVETS